MSLSGGAAYTVIRSGFLRPVGPAVLSLLHEPERSTATRAINMTVPRLITTSGAETGMVVAALARLRAVMAYSIAGLSRGPLHIRKNGRSHASDVDRLVGRRPVG